MRYKIDISLIIVTLMFVLSFILSFTIKDLDAQQNQKSNNVVGDGLIGASLQLPDNDSYKSYLKITGKSFTISDIAADIVIVQIFSMYCPHCQKDAPNMNSFFNLLKNSESYKDRIKLIGIGAGNSAFEVDFFRKTYLVEFPLLDDQDFKIHKLLGEVRTPYFIGFKRLKDGSLKIFLSEAGGDREPKAFLDQIIKQL
ncbi:MAG: redoxin domain-containing protein [Desulfamplus sp.]|nr:redoxin domain-containing protein [Desulfamplus sp.]